MTKEQTRILCLKGSIAKKTKEKEILRKTLSFMIKELCDLENELSILESGGTIEDVQKWKDNK